MANYASDDERRPQQIIIIVHGSLPNLLDGRKSLDLSHLKCIVVDEADVFFTDDKNFDVLSKLHKYKHVKDKQPQWILFSATYPSSENELIQRKMSEIINQANQIKLTPESSMDKLKNIKQYVLKC